MIRCFEDFVKVLLNAGFSMGGGNDEGIYAVIPWGWNEPPPYDTLPIAWHTDDPETDPWEWRMRVLDERDDIAYGKLFFKKSGFITKDWYPYFLAVRRGNMSFDESYDNGTISHFAKRIGMDAYKTELDEKVRILEELLAVYNDGRRRRKKPASLLVDKGLMFNPHANRTIRRPRPYL
jgi:hypothetical protein